MGRARTPVAKAAATGAAVKNPARHRARKAPAKLSALGAPPAWMDEFSKRAWAQLVAELPWLKASHRGIVEITAMLRGRILEAKGPIGLQPMQELRRCYAQLGATPADESKVTQPDEGDDDPDAALFAAPTVSKH